MKEFVVYTLARLGVFVASYAVVAGFYLLVSGDDRLPVLWPLLAAAVISAVVSVYLLKDMRHRFAGVVQQRADAATKRFDAARAKEDED